MPGRLKTILCLVLLAAVACWGPAAESQPSGSPAASQDGVEVYFSPRGGCTDAIVREIRGAKRLICVQAYSFTSVPIAQALLEAKKRGVQIEVVLDKSQKTARYSSATFLANQGIPVRIDSEHAIAHNKILLIDGETIITGSFNFSKAAEESNAENLLILRGKTQLYAAYERNFREHHAHAQVYVPPSAAAIP